MHEENSENTIARIRLGKISGTPDAIEALGLNGMLPSDLLNRHEVADWGDLSEEDKQAITEGVLQGVRPPRSSYTLPDGTVVWVITEWENDITTTVLLPSDL